MPLAQRPRDPRMERTHTETSLDASRFLRLQGLMGCREQVGPAGLREVTGGGGGEVNTRR